MSKIPNTKGDVKGAAALAKWEKEVRERTAGPRKKSQWWIRVPKKWWIEDLKNLNPAERCVLITLKIHDNPKYGCFPSTRTMAQELNLNQLTVLRTIKKLQKKGFLKIVKASGRSNSYILKSECR